MYTYSVILYGVESWTLKTSNINKLEAWVNRRMLRIPWTTHKTNIKVLRGMNKDREVMEIIKNANL